MQSYNPCVHRIRAVTVAYWVGNCMVWGIVRRQCVLFHGGRCQSAAAKVLVSRPPLGFREWRVLVPFRLLLLTSWTCFVSGAAPVFDGRSLSALLGILMRMVAKALVHSMCVGLWVMLVSVVMVHSLLIPSII